MKKRFFMLVLILYLFSAIFAKANLTKYYYSDYENVIRIVFVFDEQIDFNVKDSNNQISMLVNDCGFASTVEPNKKLKSGVLNSVNIVNTGNSIKINMNADRVASFVRKKIPNPSKYKVYFDIYNVKDPKTQSQYLNLIRFYMTAGLKRKAVRLFTNAEKYHPNYTDVNYYWGNYLAEKGKKSSALSKYKKVSKNSNLYKLAKIKMEKLGYKVPKKVVKKTAPKKTAPKKTVKKKPTVSKTQTKVSQDNSKMYEKYRNYFMKNPKARLFLIAKAAEINADYPTAIKYYKEILKKDPSKKQMIYKTLFKIYNLQGNDQKANFYNQLIDVDNTPKKSKSILDLSINLWLALTIFIVLGIITIFFTKLKIKKIEEDNEEEFTNEDVDFHLTNRTDEEETDSKEDTEISGHDDPNELLATMGNEDEDIDENVKFEVKEEEIDKEPKSKEAKDLKDELLSMDFEVNEEDKSEDKKESEEVEFKEEETLTDLTEKEEEKEPEKMVDLNFDDFDDNSSLNDEEEEELITDEMDYENSDIFDESNKEEENIDFKDDEKKKEMIMELVSDGWDIEAISKELQIPKREVEFIIEVES